MYVMVVSSRCRRLSLYPQVVELGNHVLHKGKGFIDVPEEDLVGFGGMKERYARGTLDNNDPEENKMGEVCGPGAERLKMYQFATRHRKSIIIAQSWKS